MTTYALILILIVGIPFLLYCLWNFGCELRPRRSHAVFSSGSRRPSPLGAVPLSQLRGRPHMVQVRGEGRMAS
jgi:hypothetical protein